MTIFFCSSFHSIHDFFYTDTEETEVEYTCLTDPVRDHWESEEVQNKWNTIFEERQKILQKKGENVIDTYLNTFHCLADRIGILLVSHYLLKISNYPL